MSLYAYQVMLDFHSLQWWNPGCLDPVHQGKINKWGRGRLWTSPFARSWFSLSTGDILNQLREGYMDSDRKAEFPSELASLSLLMWVLGSVAAARPTALASGRAVLFLRAASGSEVRIWLWELWGCDGNPGHVLIVVVQRVPECVKTQNVLKQL